MVAMRRRGASLTNEIKTILADPFINVLSDELNNLNNKNVIDILIDEIDEGST